MTRTRAEVKEQGTPTKYKRIYVESFGNVADNIIRVHTHAGDVFMVFEKVKNTRNAWRKLGSSMEEKRVLQVEYYVRDYGNQITKDHNVVTNIKLLPKSRKKVEREKASTRFKKIIVVGFDNVTNNVVRVHTKDDVFFVLESTKSTYDSHRKMGLSMEEERELLVEYYQKNHGNKVTLGHKVIVNMKLLPNKQSKRSWPSIDEAKLKLNKHGASW